MGDKVQRWQWVTSEGVAVGDKVQGWQWVTTCRGGNGYQEAVEPDNREHSLNIYSAVWTKCPLPLK